MDVILLEKVGKIGDVGDQVSVKSGYARNYLFPFAKAVPATKENVAEFEARKEELLKAANEKLAEARTRAEKLNGLSVSIAANAGEEGKLFGSIGTRDIADAVSELGEPIEKSEVLLPEGALRETGEFQISLSLGSEVTADITLHITPMEAPEATIQTAAELEADEAGTEAPLEAEQPDQQDAAPDHSETEASEEERED